MPSSANTLARACPPPSSSASVCHSFTSCLLFFKNLKMALLDNVLPGHHSFKTFTVGNYKSTNPTTNLLSPPPSHFNRCTHVVDLLLDRSPGSPTSRSGLKTRRSPLVDLVRRCHRCPLCHYQHLDHPQAWCRYHLRDYCLFPAGLLVHH